MKNVNKFTRKKSKSVLVIMWRNWWVNGWVWKKLEGIILKFSCSSRIWYSMSASIYYLTTIAVCNTWGQEYFESGSQKEREDIVENTEMHTAIFLQLFLALVLSALTTRHWQRVRWKMLGSASRDWRIEIRELQTKGEVDSNSINGYPQNVHEKWKYKANNCDKHIV